MLRIPFFISAALAIGIVGGKLVAAQTPKTQELVLIALGFIVVVLGFVIILCASAGR